MIPNGTHMGKVVGFGLGGLENGKEHVAIEFEFYELEGAPRMTWYGYLHTEKVFPRTMKVLREIGWHGTDVSDLTGMEELEASLVVETEEYEGKQRQKIKWVNSPNGGPAYAQMDSPAVKQFAAGLRGRIAAFDQSNVAPKVNGKPVARAKPRAEASDEIADDMPF